MATKDEALKRGYRMMRTIKGAPWRGVLVSIFNTLDGTEHVVLEAVDEGFERSCHLYPSAQVAFDEAPNA